MLRSKTLKDCRIRCCNTYCYSIYWLYRYSVAIDTGLYTPATTTQGSTLSKEAIESLRQQLIKNGDSNVQGKTSDASTEAATATKC